jgi:hypothetical protein
MSDVYVESTGEWARTMFLRWQLRHVTVTVPNSPSVQFETRVETFLQQKFLNVRTMREVWRDVPFEVDDRRSPMEAQAAPAVREMPVAEGDKPPRDPERL